MLQVVHRDGFRKALPKLACSSAAGSISEPSPAAPADKHLLPPAPDTKGIAPQRRWNAVCLAFLGDGVWEVGTLRQQMPQLVPLVVFSPEMVVFPLCLSCGRHLTGLVSMPVMHPSECLQEQVIVPPSSQL